MTVILTIVNMMNIQRLSSFVGAHATKLTGTITSTHALFERTVEVYWVWFKRHAATPVRVLFATTPERCRGTFPAAKVPWFLLTGCHIARERLATIATSTLLSRNTFCLSTLLEALYGSAAVFWRQVLPACFYAFADGWTCQPIERRPVTCPGAEMAVRGRAGKEFFFAPLANMKNLSALPSRMVLWCRSEINTIASTATESCARFARRRAKSNSTLFTSQFDRHLRRSLSQLVEKSNGVHL